MTPQDWTRFDAKARGFARFGYAPDDFTAWDDLQSTGERLLAYVLIALIGAAVILLGLWVAA